MLTKLTGLILKQPFIHTWLLKLAKRTPDEHITSPDGTDVYMYRYWLFNKIDANHQRKYAWIPFSIRIHHIVRHDLDRHLHDHPFNARTWIMRGGYAEVRREEIKNRQFHMKGLMDVFSLDKASAAHWHLHYRHGPGDSTTLDFDQYHRIVEVAKGGALTFFAFGRYKGSWGFMVDGKKVLRADYEKTYQGPLELNVAAFLGECAATQQSDMMVCDQCTEAWDVNDPHPPICSYTGQPGRTSGGPTPGLIQPTQPWSQGK